MKTQCLASSAGELATIKSLSTIKIRFIAWISNSKHSPNLQKFHLQN